MCHEQLHVVINKKAQKRQPAGNKADGASDFCFQDHGEPNWVALGNQANRYACDHLTLICRHCDALELEYFALLVLMQKDPSCRGESGMAD